VLLTCICFNNEYEGNSLVLYIDCCIYSSFFLVWMAYFCCKNALCYLSFCNTLYFSELHTNTSWSELHFSSVYVIQYCCNWCLFVLSCSTKTNWLELKCYLINSCRSLVSVENPLQFILAIHRLLQLYIFQFFSLNGVFFVAEMLVLKSFCNMWYFSELHTNSGFSVNIHELAVG